MATKLFSRFQRMKTVKAYTYGPPETAVDGRLTGQSIQLPIYICAAGNASFVVPIPEYVARLFGKWAPCSEWSEDEKTLIERDNKTGTYYITTVANVDKITELYRQVMLAYKRKVERERATRVIMLRVWAFDSESKKTFETHELFRCGPDKYPMVMFDYKVLWRMGKDLYQQDSPEEEFSYVDPHSFRSNIELPWSEETEAACASIRQDMQSLSSRVAKFFDLPSEQLVQRLTQSTNLLPGPSAEPTSAPVSKALRRERK